MAWFGSALDNVWVASPCRADWNEMYGDDRKLFCGDCKLNVYNLSGMSRAEAERLITNMEGRLCVRLFRRRDGSIITADCPVGWARVKQKTRRHVTAAFAMLAALFSGTFVASYLSRVSDNPVARTMKPTEPRATPMMGNFVLGVLPNKEREKAPAHKPGRALREVSEID